MSINAARSTLPEKLIKHVEKPLETSVFSGLYSDTSIKYVSSSTNESKKSFMSTKGSKNIASPLEASNLISPTRKNLDRSSSEISFPPSEELSVLAEVAETVTVETVEESVEVTVQEIENKSIKTNKQKNCPKKKNPGRDNIIM